MLNNEPVQYHLSLPLPCAHAKCTVRHITHPVTLQHIIDNFLYTLTLLGVVNNVGRPPLGEAVYGNRLEVVKYLITEHGVDVNGGL